MITAARGRLSCRGSIIFTWVQSAAALSGGFLRRSRAGLSIRSFALLARPLVHPTAGCGGLTLCGVALHVYLTGEVHRFDGPHIDASRRLNTSFPLEFNQRLPRARTVNPVSFTLQETSLDKHGLNLADVAPTEVRCSCTGDPTSGRTSVDIRPSGSNLTDESRSVSIGLDGGIIVHGTFRRMLRAGRIEGGSLRSSTGQVERRQLL